MTWTTGKIGVALTLALALTAGEVRAQTSVTAQGRDSVEAPQDLLEAAQQVLGLSAAALQTIEVVGGPDGPWTAQLGLAGQLLDLQMHRRSVRAAGFRLKAQQADGSWALVEPGPERTVRGSVAGLPGARMAGSIIDGALWGLVVMPGGERWWVEPVAAHVAGAPDDVHVVYSSADVLPTGATCAVAAEVAFEQGQIPQGGVAGGVPELICPTELATDADVEYFEDWGGVQEVQDRISLVINTMNLQYESEVAITHVLTTMLVRTSEPDPYTAFDSGSLLCEFITEWTDNQSDIVRDAAQLFTGREISGSVIGQAADIGATGICQNSGGCSGGQFGTFGSYCQVQSDFNNNFACATDLSSHELGHLWGAFHCSCPSNTMNPSITCANTFSAGSVSSISSYRDTRDCIDCMGPITFAFPDGLPDLLDPDGDTVRVVVEPELSQPQPGTGRLFYRTNEGSFQSVNMAQIEPNVYDAVFPAQQCADIVDFYFSAQSAESVTVTEPFDAPGEVFTAIAGNSVSNAFIDDFETDMGWTVQNNALTAGAWEIGVPVNCFRGDPPADDDGSGNCFLTENDPNDCNSDVDGGSTALISPVLDASSAQILAYSRWFSNNTGDSPETETFTVEYSEDGGGSWLDLETIGPAGVEVRGGWFRKQFNLAAAGIDATDQFRVRYTTQDFAPGAIVEAAVDGVKLIAVDCDQGQPCPADISGDGEVSVADLTALVLAWGPCPDCPEDINGDDEVDVQDLTALILAWGECP